ncbi:type II secretion system F family protein, partial [Streptococcus pseudopneumoniae]|uniref:type II secretion system F family protein n=1 Tax=Streptococcus pseudopneumoniae TaxID=257758 RepID=UPI0018B0AC66
EQSLKVLSTDAEKVLPELTKEIRPILRRAEQGLDLGEELQKSSQALQHTDYTDVVVIIRQMLKQGGSARASLSKMVEL